MIPNGTPCHFWHYGDNTVKVGKVVSQPDMAAGKIWGGHAADIRYGVQFEDPQFGTMLVYAKTADIIPYNMQEAQ